ncbi:PAS domain-containing protein [bacterium SCSIO 12741]|nr:PAS domain-containing protein [bacterium SCSIO 12741]
MESDILYGDSSAASTQDPRAFVDHFWRDFHGIVFRLNLKKGGQIAFLSPGIESLTGYAIDDFLSGKRKLRDFIHPDDYHYISEQFRHLNPTNNFFNFDHRIITQDRVTVMVNSVGQLFYDENGIPDYIDGVISETSGAAATNNTDKIISSINHNVKEGIYRSKLSGEIIYANTAMSMLFGYEDEEFKSIKASDLYVSLNDREETVNRLIREGEFHNLEVEFRRKDGSTFWGLLNSSIVDLKGDDGIIDGVVIDISDKKKMEEELQRSNLDLKKVNFELNMLVYKTSHDLRAPIASLMGLTDLIRMETQSEEIEQYTRMLDNQLRRLDKAVLDIINARMVSRYGITTEQVKIAPLIDDILESMRFMDQYEEIEKQIQIQEKGKFFTSENDLKIVLNNLISNAIKYVDTQKAQSFLRIIVKVDSEKAFLEITDNGIGIQESQLKNIFDIFFRATSNNKGTGLGLYIVKQAIEKMKGTIEVDSTATAGSRFTIVLPNLGEQEMDEQKED